MYALQVLLFSIHEINAGTDFVANYVAIILLWTP